MTGPQDPAAAGRDRLRAGHADREQVIQTLKDAFVDGRLTRDELDTRAGRALAARTYADLAELIADIPVAPAAPPPTPAPTPTLAPAPAAPAAAAPAAAGPARPPAPARRRPLARAAAGSGGCLVIAAAAVRAAFIFDPGPPGPTPYHSWARLMLLVAFIALLTALGIMGFGVASSVEQRRSRGQLPPGPGPDGHAPDGERRGDTGHGPVPPAPRTGQAPCTDLRAHQSRQRSPGRSGPGRSSPAPTGRAPRGARPAPGAV